MLKNEDGQGIAGDLSGPLRAMDIVRGNDEITRQFVTFQVQDETFAVALSNVQEIIRLPAMVRVPLAPPCLEGLSNLRGIILPIIGLRRIFQMTRAEHTDATRVVVINDGKPMGFVVDTMSRVVTVEPHEIEAIDTIAASINADFLDGIIKRDRSMIMILNTAKLARESSGAAQSHRGTQADRSQPQTGQTGELVSDEIQLVSFELDDQEYAVPIEHVQEIVQIPDVISSIPNAPDHIVGVVNLRNRLLPLISLRMMFGLPSVGLGEQSRVVVITQEFDGVTHSVGLVTDKVKEVLRVAKSLVDPLPNLLSSDAGAKEITQICRLDGGKRLVSILTPERLFGAKDYFDAGQQLAGQPIVSENDRIMDMVGGGIDEEDQFVVFRVAAEEYGVPINSVQEIVRIPEQVTHVPKAPDFIEGVINLRGLVLPIVDQRLRFDLPIIERNDHQRVIVFMIHGIRIGFIVDSVSEVLKISRTQIAPAPVLSAQGGAVVSSVANIVGLKRMILMLDIEHLLSAEETNSLKTASSS